MLSRRSHWNAPTNRLSAAREACARSGRPLFDLTETNPTRIGLEYPEEELAAAMARGARARHDPDPRGVLTAREALAVSLSTPGDSVSPDDLVLTASTSEAYSFLFKILCDPGDEILTAVPSYPLLDHLAALESVRLVHFPLEPGARWNLDAGEVRRAASDRTRAVVAIHPNNPTGSFLKVAEQDALVEWCESRGAALISDEVFLDYPIDAAEPAGPAAKHGRALTFSLGGLSKSAGLPHYKLGWIRAGGEGSAKRAALAALELVADHFLSVSTPVQSALPELLTLAPRIRDQIRARTRKNYAALGKASAGLPSVESLPVEGGWSAVLRVPRLSSDEELALTLLENDGVLVHPGYFFDFPSEGFLVLSLLPDPKIFEAGLACLAARLTARA